MSPKAIVVNLPRINSDTRNYKRQTFVKKATYSEHFNIIYNSMKQSEIKFTVELDKDSVPEKIYWDATDKGDDGLASTKSVSIALWDHLSKNTMRIDLWTKDMPVDEMKRFYIDCIGGLGQSILSATGDTFMADELNALCDKFIKHLQEENKRLSQG